jgi:GTP-binding protein Era
VSTPAHRCGHVAIVGRPSVGKSTLVNALVGEKVSITSKKPQTTRHRILGILSEPAAQYILVDTPGFQNRHRSRLNTRLNRTVRESLSSVDVVVAVQDASGETAEDRAVLALLPANLPVIAALNKIDLLRDKSTLLPRIADLARERSFAAIVPVSAEDGDGLDALKQEIVERLPESPSLYPEDELTDRDERFLAAEAVREKIFRLLGDEIPYATTVSVDAFEHVGDTRKIHVTVLVEKPGQRALLLGEGGSRMKAIGTQARRDLEHRFGGKVFLEIWVRVKRGWANDDAALARLGY